MALFINDVLPRVRYTATTNQTAFTVPFAFANAADLKVYKNGALRTLTTHYTVSGVGSSSGGSITLTSGAALNDSIVILRDRPLTRSSDFPLAGPFEITALNNEFDTVYGLLAQLEMFYSRTIHLGNTDTPDAFVDLPDKVTRANKALAFDVNGDLTVVASLGGGGGGTGAAWLTGSGTPSAGTGNVGDFFLNNANGDFYEKTATSTWTLRGNLKGPQGPAGPQGTTGSQGSIGPQGPQGSTGNPGADGAPGSKWSTGSGAPAGGLGTIGDFYLNTANGDVYEKTGSSVWTLRDNLTGPAGSTGATGPQGSPGATGSTGSAGADGTKWFFGSGAPAGGLGVNGDFYLNTANGDVYNKASGSWSVVDNLTGPSGAGSGDVVGPASSTTDDIALFASGTGKLLKDGGKKLGDYVEKTGVTAMTGKLTLVASSSSAASLNVPVGSAPSSPAAGDLWTTTTSLLVRLNSVSLNLAALNLAQTWTAGVKQTFGHDATNAGINVAPASGDPSSPANGDLWLNSTTNKFKIRINGATQIASLEGHTHAESDITNLVSDLAGKAATSHTHTAADITDFAEAHDDRLNAMLVMGTGLTKTYDDAGNTLTITPNGVIPVPSERTTTSETLALTDAGALVRMNNASASTLTVPTNASVAFAIGTTIIVAEIGAGIVTIAAAGGVTITSQGNKFKLNGAGAQCTLTKIGTDAWLLSGNLTT